MDSPADSGPSRVRLLLAAGVGVGLLGLAAVWLWWPHDEPAEVEPDPVPVVDPRLSFPTPYKNVRPDVKYVGDAGCVDCHQDQFKTYQHHPMGQAMALVGEATPIERYSLFDLNPFPVPDLWYGVGHRDGRVYHREWAPGPDGKPLAEVEAEVQYAVGSGAKARSYILNRDGYLFESPITWFPHGGRWDLSPSYEVRNQHFNRVVAPGCLFCHSNQADHVPGTVNRYRAPIFHGLSIGCERCHGPGELHVRARTSAEAVVGTDDTIVNPARLEHHLREAICQQCHIQGEQRILARGRSDFDFRPGLPLHLFLMDFVDGRNRQADHKFVSSVEQMMASRCYAGSREPNKMGCITCHDPHKHPTGAEKVAHYRARCLQCHTDQNCAVPVATRRETQKDDSCVACHMPPTGSEVNHSAITDHRIPRRAEKAAGKPTRRDTPGPDDLVPFHQAQIPADEELPRNFGLALMAMLDRGPPPAVQRLYAERALPLLEKAVRRDRHDGAAWDSRADALFLVGRADEAGSAYAAAVAARPGSESTLHGAANVALAVNRLNEARDYLERAVHINPWNWRYHFDLARVSFRRKDWTRAVRECEQALGLEPTNRDVRSLLVLCHLWAGSRDTAAAEYETLRLLTPANRRADLAGWWDDERRRAPGR
ncbi:MAG TPA: tetratricopeptide repeat protein [Gemmataceae bacterium]|nr:tetratricopeptide repeat protein [Gemmataceae bacterium]